MTCPTCEDTAHAHSLRTDAQAQLGLAPVSNPWVRGPEINTRGGEYVSLWTCGRSAPTRIVEVPCLGRTPLSLAGAKPYLQGKCFGCNAHCAWEG